MQEINEFISYSEVKSELRQYQQEYNEIFSRKKKSSLNHVNNGN